MAKCLGKLNDGKPILKAKALHFTQELRMSKRLIKQTEPLVLGVTVPRRVVTQCRNFQIQITGCSPKLKVEKPIFSVEKSLNFSNV